MMSEKRITIKTLCKHCETCKTYEYERIDRKGHPQRFLYCNGNKDEVGLSNWYIQKDGYAYSTGRINGKKIFFHTILKDDDTKVVDHINGFRIDNRLRNLRLVTPLQNAQNTHYVKKTSRFPGVHWNKKMRKWVSQAKKGKQARNGYFHLGTFDDEYEAFHSYVQFIRSTGLEVDHNPKYWFDYENWLSERSQTTLI